MDLSNYKIAIFTRSMNYTLYKMSSNTISLPFKHYRLTYTTADGYLYKILKYDIDYAINIDEDAFVINNEALFELLKYCIQEKIVNCGMRDGGILPIRHGNPIVTNPFFNIINVGIIRKYFSISVVNGNLNTDIDYDRFLPLNLPYKFEISDDYEPFYPFFLWLDTNFSTLFLNAKEHKDGYTTILYNHLNKPIIYHSWFSRNYGMDKFHTNRISNLYHSCVNVEVNFSPFEKLRIAIERLLNQKAIPMILPIRRKFKKIMKS